MNYEENRLATFSAWPTDAPLDPIRIAAAGFYYTGRGTEVQCFSCGGKISEWTAGDPPRNRHYRLDPRCPFLSHPSSAGNVALLLHLRASAPDSAPTTSEPGPAMPITNATEEDEIYRNDALRLLSFINWPVSFISRESLVSAGFYHAGGGTVRCAWCGGELCGGWRQGDQPLEEHRRHFPNCEFVQMTLAQQSRVVIDVPSLPETPLLGSPHLEEVQPQTEAVEHNWRILDGLPWRGLGVISSGVEGARHPARSSLNSRLSTFTGWPISLRQTPVLLAEAGFFYTGTDDQVRCFYCDGGLGKWEPSDTPWTEHARWFPECGFVLLVKGREFVERYRSRNSGEQRNLLSEEEISNALRPPVVNRVQYPVTESQVEAEMESREAMAALGAGLGASRVRTAIRRRLRNIGVPFTSSEALIDAALNEQLNEEAWSESPQNQRLARDILSETLRSFSAGQTIQPDVWEEEDVSNFGDSLSPADSLTPSQNTTSNTSDPTSNTSDPTSNTSTTSEEKAKSPAPSPSPSGKCMSLEEENRQLKEARLCKVCMDSEVSVVFLPCGHLVSCGACGASLTACPLCRASVRALVRAYLA